MMRAMRCNREMLLDQINTVSFAAYDMLLYLDTHPKDEKALAYYQEQCCRRKQLLDDYACQFGPLTADCACQTDCPDWAWIMQPWPWENCQKGGMR